MNEQAETTTGPVPGTTREIENCRIAGVEILDPRFPENAGPDDFEICFTIAYNDPQTGILQNVEVPLEFSNVYGVGQNSSKTRAQIAIEELAALGYRYGADVTRVSELVGKPCRLFGKVSPKGRWNYYFSHRKPRAKAANVAQKLARLMGQQVAPVPAAPVAKQPTPIELEMEADADPFA